MTTKDDIRSLMKERRASLSKSEMRERSKMILENLLSLPDFFRHDVVHTYVSSKNNEADTHELIRVLVKQRKRVIVPVSDPKTKLMRHSELFSLGELIGGAYGILEPRMVRPVPADDLQVIVVPALAVDHRGNRVGFGAGFYDRFLHHIQVPTIALAYDFQVLPTVPSDSTDVPISFIITENEIIRCRN